MAEIGSILFSLENTLLKLSRPSFAATPPLPGLADEELKKAPPRSSYARAPAVRVESAISAINMNNLNNQPPIFDKKLPRKEFPEALRWLYTKAPAKGKPLSGSLADAGSAGGSPMAAHDTALVGGIFSFAAAVVAGLLAVSHFDDMRRGMTRLETAAALQLILFAVIAFGLSVTSATHDDLDALEERGKQMMYSSVAFNAAALLAVGVVLLLVKLGGDGSAVRVYPWTLAGVVVALLVAGVLSSVTAARYVE